jgi:Hg(II)-responsive transcriptional regulator
MRTMTSGKLARAAGVKVETLRYYERMGLLPEPARRPSGYRQYTAEDLAAVRFIKRAQGLGFSLREIADLLALRVDAETSCAEVRERAEAKLADVEAKIADLDRIRGALARLVQACTGAGPSGHCPILDALEGDLQEDPARDGDVRR